MSYPVKCLTLRVCFECMFSNVGRSLQTLFPYRSFCTYFKGWASQTNTVMKARDVGLG